MKGNESVLKEPLGRDWTYLSRLYFGVVTKKLSPLEIERHYYALLLIKENNGKITQKELAEKTRTDKVFVVKILDYLSDKGMIKRTTNEKDRREHFISLTPKGEKQIPMIEQAFREATEEAFRGLSSEEQDLYVKITGRIKTNLESLPADEVKVNFKKIKKSTK